jgi:hypothetical protein
MLELRNTAIDVKSRGASEWHYVSQPLMRRRPPQLHQLHHAVSLDQNRGQDRKQQQDDPNSPHA